MDIKYYAEFDFLALQQLSITLFPEGVTMEVLNFPLWMVNLTARNLIGTTFVRKKQVTPTQNQIKVGKQQMNGSHLAEYNRFRDDDEGDYGRPETSTTSHVSRSWARSKINQCYRVWGMERVFYLTIYPIAYCSTNGLSVIEGVRMVSKD